MPLDRPDAAPDFHSLFESAPGLYLVLTPDLRIVAVTDGYLRATMTTREGILGRYLFDVFPDNPADPSATGVNNLRASLERVRANRAADVMAIQKYDIRRPEPEGSIFEERYWSPINSPVFGRAGGIEYIIHRVEDVTEFVRLKQRGMQQDEATGALRRQAEQMEAEIYARAQELVEANRQLLSANVALNHLYRQIADLTRQADRDLRVGMSWHDPAEPLSDSVAPEEMLARVGRLIRARNQLEEQLRQAQKMEAVGRLAGGIAHDFNNLLTVILGYSAILREELQAGQALESVDEIEKAAARAASLTGQLLAFSRKQVMQLRVLDLNSIVAGMKSMLQRLIGEDISLKTELDPELAKVKADGGQIEQVLMNLAVNARDAMPDGGTLLIATRNVRPDAATAMRPARVSEGLVSLRVTDTGQGMDQETQKRIFEPFFTTKAVGKGTGLGLATSYGIVEQCGGTIAVESEVGRGTTITILLPATVEEASEPQEPSASGMGASLGTILVVEDEASLRKLVCSALKGAAYQLLEAAGGREGLELARSFPGRIDLLLTDVVMPEINGPRLAELLRKDRPDLITLFMSGYDQNLIGQNLMSEAVHFLPKPFTTKVLLEKTRNVLGIRPICSGAPCAGDGTPPE
ncbi:MAG TPA: ATP-binding protein [Bryobacteraceae bacterium]|nr:ATP-binding protein [Bryobacteraceae bacterium]